MLPASGVTVTGVTVDGVTLSPTVYTADLVAGIVYDVPCAAARLGVTVTYTAGSTTVPANLQLAALELIRHLWQSSRQSGRPGGIQAASDTVATPFGFAVPKRVVELCEATNSAPGFA